SETMIDEEALKVTAMSEGMLTLSDSAREMVLMGESTVDEMVRVTGSD
ncbi:MAG: type IV pilus assembly protein PilB, partial [Thalassolituus oleivorans]